METALLWTPKRMLASLTPYERFSERIAKKFEVKLNSYWDLHKWSVDYYPEFWTEVVHFCDIIHTGKWSQAVDKSKRIDEIPKWFTGMRLNYAENLLKRNDDKVAIYYAGEYTNEVRKVTFKQLRQSVQAYAAGLKKLGVGCGDRVAGYLPNCPEAVYAMLATASLGAVWSSASPDFGVVAVVERFEQVKPKLLFGVEAVIYNQKFHDSIGKMSEIMAALPTVQTLVMVPFVDTPNGHEKRSLPKCMTLKSFLDDARLHDGTYPPLQFEQVPFDHPLFIMFSSGTTGAPKCMVHSVGGTLLKHTQEHSLQLCLTSSDTLMFYTTVGWMMWNWLVSALAQGTAVVLYDGSPFLPRVDVMLDLIDSVGITVHGMGAKLFATYESKNLIPMQTHKLNTLRALLSTGSPLMSHTFEYIFQCIKNDVLVGSISGLSRYICSKLAAALSTGISNAINETGWRKVVPLTSVSRLERIKQQQDTCSAIGNIIHRGGTDLIACFIGATCNLPVHSGEIQAPLLGCSIKCYNEEGKAVFDQSGELVCTNPFPSMPTHFLNDPNGKKYRKAYFEKFPGVWAHGDFCVVNSSTGGFVMLGRSDGTLNPAGVRFGSAEIYHLVEKVVEVADSLCVGQKLPEGDERVVLFLKMADGCEFNEQLVERIRQTIRDGLSARHVPFAILPIADIPYTTNGKKVEVAVKQILSGEKVANRSALANPQSLDLYVDIPQLRIANGPGSKPVISHY